jgi:hypothetical protein
LGSYNLVFKVQRKKAAATTSVRYNRRMKYIVAVAVGVVLLFGVWFYMQTQDKGVVPDIHVSEPTTFSQVGTLRFPTPTSGQATGTFEYAVNSAPVSKALVMDELSICSASNGATPCMAMSITFDVPYDGKRAIVEGIEQGDLVVVRKLYLLQEGEPETPTTPGSVFISWYHAIELLKACQVTLATQTHAHDVYLTLKDGRKVRAVEPMIDDVFDVVNQTRETCGTFPIATE